jgi:hypothetical protein
MGILSWLLGRSVDPEPEGSIDGPGTFEVEVVGESRYQKALRRICGRCGPEGVELVIQCNLVLEDDNSHDDQAVRVAIGDATVGYLTRENARAYRSELRRVGHPRLRGTCWGKIRGGFERDDGSKALLGVFLDLPTVES